MVDSVEGGNFELREAPQRFQGRGLVVFAEGDDGLRSGQRAAPGVAENLVEQRRQSGGVVGHPGIFADG